MGDYTYNESTGKSTPTYRYQGGDGDIQTTGSLQLSDTDVLKDTTGHSRIGWTDTGHTMIYDEAGNDALKIGTDRTISVEGNIIRASDDGATITMDTSDNVTVGGQFLPGAFNSDFVTVTTDTTAGANTWSAAEFIGGLLLRDCVGTGRSDVTPTATQIVGAIANCKVGTAFRVIIRNTSDAAETITITAGTGVSLSGTMTIAQNNTKEFLCVITNVGSPAATLYSLGTYVH
tara:strand:- start:26 stop:721 length:696 start_codon:yes stop_codon:yes gene_type:complete